jgi:hypothetical protein
MPVGHYSGTRPTEIDFSGDAGNVATRIRWASWGSDSAVGYGIVGVNNCTPNCAEGQITFQDVTITLSHPIGNPLVWGKMTEVISGQAAWHWTYPNNWPLSAL